MLQQHAARASSHFYCGRASSSFVSRFSSLQTSVVDDDDDEVDQEWTAVKPTKKPLGLGKAPVGILTTKQKDQRNDNENTSNNTWSSPLELLYTGNHKVPITSKLHIVTPQQDTPRGIWPVFRIMVRLKYIYTCLRVAVVFTSAVI